MLSRLVRQPGSTLVKLSSLLWTRLRMNGVATSKSPPYELNLDLNLGPGLSRWSGDPFGNCIELGASTLIGMAPGNSNIALVPGTVGDSSVLNGSRTLTSSSDNPLRNGAGFSLGGSHTPSSRSLSGGVIGRDPKPLSSDPDIRLFVSAMEYRLNGSSVRPKSWEAANGDCG